MEKFPLMTSGKLFQFYSRQLAVRLKSLFSIKFHPFLLNREKSFFSDNFLTFVADFESDEIEQSSCWLSVQDNDLKAELMGYFPDITFSILTGDKA